jgi:hypothetical protein
VPFIVAQIPGRSNGATLIRLPGAGSGGGHITHGSGSGEQGKTPSSLTRPLISRTGTVSK